MMNAVATAADTAERISGQAPVQPLGLEALTLVERLHRGSNLRTVQMRKSFAESAVNMVQTGASNLVLADTISESANLPTLQIRQPLSAAALSVANQAVLRMLV